MIRKGFMSFLMLFVLLSTLSAFGEGTMAMTLSPSHFSSGQALYIFFSLPEDGLVDMVVLDEQGIQKASILEQYEAQEGGNELTWDGMGADGRPVAPGKYQVHLTQVTASASRAMDMDIVIEAEAPVGLSLINSASASVLELEDDGHVENPMPEDSNLPVQASQSAITPAYLSTHQPAEPHENCYWCTPMDITDEAAVWAMLTAPVTVVDGHQKTQVVLLAEPDNDSEGVGVITCDSQSVHVLETLDNGWSFVETYSSSFHDSKVKAWNAFVAGYIRTDKLKTKQPRTEYGMIVDKLTQEIYIFKDGKFFSKLLISTGLYNEKQPYNETRSGEFLIVSRVGEFRSDNLFCAMALRFNSGDLLHEVPHVKNADGSKSYKNTEFKLGTRASHGCIRVQRLRNNDGLNMKWLWDNMKVNTKMVIWEDFAGRQIIPPDDSLKLYYNPDGGANFHSADRCNGVKESFLPFSGSFSYSDLTDAEHEKLTPCWYCNPPRRPEEIQEINEIHLTESPGMVPQVPPKK